MTTTVTALPGKFTVEVDPDTRDLGRRFLFGGSPSRVVRLTEAGHDAWLELGRGGVDSAAARRLARTLTDAGLVHPRPPVISGKPDVTVVIPVRDRAVMLDRLLDALGRECRVVVVDDGSGDGPGVEAVCTRHGARVWRTEASHGPAAARNLALEHVDSEFVAFIDSDCVPPPGWIPTLAAHFADPLVAAVAPRLSALNAASAVERYGCACGSLDLGARPARVVPMSRVSYVPTAALLVRVAALSGATFDGQLRYGEDVDLVWRLHEAGWRIRYDPSVVVGHEEPATWSALLRRRFRYGTSAAPLGRRHPDNIAPLVLAPASFVSAAAVIARRPVVAGLAAGISLGLLRRRLDAAGVPRTGMVKATGQAVVQTVLGLGRWCTQFALPALAVAAFLPGRRRSRLGRRLAIAGLVLAPIVQTWRQQRPPLNPVAFVLARIADDAAYGAGVWAGCLRHRTVLPLRPRRARSSVPRPTAPSAAPPTSRPERP